MANVTVTSRAAEVLRRIRSERGGVLTITIDGGCCEGTAPHLYEDYVVPYGSHAIGEAEGVEILVPPSFKEQYENAAITLDLIDQPLSDVLSIETEHGVRLVMRHDV